MKRLVEAWGRYYTSADVIHSGGPVRVATDQPDPTFKRRPVGFTADLDEPTDEPEIQEPPC